MEKGKYKILKDKKYFIQWKIMSKKEKIIIGILILIAIIAIFVLVAIRRNNTNNIALEEENQVQDEEYVEVLEDDTRLNTSDKLQETKIFDEMEISNIQLTEKDNMTVLLGTIKNNSSTVKGGYPVNITVLDKSGNEIITVAAYIKELQPGESTQLSTSATFDYANAYDFTITKR